MREKYQPKQFKFPKKSYQRLHYRLPETCLETGGKIYFSGQFCRAFARYDVHLPNRIVRISFQKYFPKDRPHSAKRALKRFYKEIIRKYGKNNVKWVR